MAFKKATVFMKTFGIMLWIALIISISHTTSAKSVVVPRKKEAPETVNIGAIMALDTIIGKIAKSAIDLAAEDVNSDHNILKSTRLFIDIRSSNQNAVTGAFSALEMLKNESVAIVGPQSSIVSEFVAKLGDTAHVPVVTFEATNPSLSMHRYPYFIRFSHNNSLQMHAIADIVQHFGWREVVVVYSDDDFGTGAVPSLNNALRDARTKIVYSAAISPQANIKAIQDLLHNLLSLESQVFIVHIHPDFGMELFSEAKKMGMIDTEYVWIISEGLASIIDSLSLKGALGIKTNIPESTQQRLQKVTAKWKRRFRAENPTIRNPELNVHGLTAYDTVWAIAHAIHNLLRSGEFDMKFMEPSEEENRRKILHYDVRVFQGGEQMRKMLLNTDFSGLTGAVRLGNDGEPLHCTYDIINAVGKGKQSRLVGRWTKEDGLQLRSNDPKKKQKSSKQYQEVIWPGGSKNVPRGWVIPTKEKKVLRIGVPCEQGYRQFVSVMRNSQNVSNISVSGFSIDVFKAVVKNLGYDLPYEFVPHGNGNVTDGYYDDLAYQVYLKKYDAVVGDVSVTAHRSKYVDFSQPYTETGLIMIVRFQKDGSGDPWAFLRPFNLAMWITTFAFFFFTGGVVWLLEHRNNQEFRGKPWKQVFTLIWFSFSTLSFSHRERVVSSLGRVVLLIWLFVVFVLSSSYTASLSSMLTVRQILPEVQSVDSLINQKLPIGYHRGSFVGTYLREKLGIDQRLLIPYSSMEQYADGLRKGPKNGGVAAVFENEVIAQNIFLSTECKKYTTVGPTYKTGGFGFVFPKGSLLVSDISKAVLNFSESKDMQSIRDKWFNKSKCNSTDTRLDSNRLSLEDFWGLFLLSGAVSFLTMIFYSFRQALQYIHGLPNDFTEYPSPNDR